MFSQRFITMLLVFSTQVVFAGDESFFKTFVTAKQIKIMAYNVENLFDAAHDRGKNDFEFLPKSSTQKQNCPEKGKYSESCRNTDWTAKKVGWKLDTIATALEEAGDYPDVLALSEVENPAVVGQLAKRLGYDGFVMTNSPDARGIDLAVLYKTTRLKLLEFEEAEVDDAKYATRNASAVHFEVTLGRSSRKNILGVYPAHWPSQGSPDPMVRITAGMTMRRLLDKYATKYKDENYHAVALGDFNCLESENPHPIKKVILDSSWSNRMLDTETLAAAAKNPYMKHFPPGTYYYGRTGEWNKFDRIFLSRNLADGTGLDVKPHTYRVNATSKLSRVLETGLQVPYRFNHAAENKKWLGFSDHYGVHVILEMQ